MKKGIKCRFVQLLERVAEGGGCFVDIGVATNDLQDVAESQPQARHGRHLDVGTTDPGYGDSKALAEIEFADGFAEHVAACYNHAAEGDVAFGEDEVFIAALTNDTLELIDHGTSTDDCESVVAMNDGRVRGGTCFLAVAHAGNRDARLYGRGSLQAIQVGIRHDERMAFDWLGLAAILGDEESAASRTESTRETSLSTSSIPMMPTIAMG